jgi:uncharacterized protein
LSLGLDGSRLCLECGLCCQGILHGSVPVRQDEVLAVRRLGLPVVETGEGASFPQPCACHQGGRCTVYGERPSACRGYRCKLLGRYEEGALTWDQSLQHIRQAKGLVASLHRRLGPESAAIGLWQRLQTGERLAEAPENRELLLDAAALLVVAQSHFHVHAEPREVLGA